MTFQTRTILPFAFSPSASTPSSDCASTTSASRPPAGVPTLPPSAHRATAGTARARRSRRSPRRAPSAARSRLRRGRSRSPAPSARPRPTRPRARRGEPESRGPTVSVRLRIVSYAPFVSEAARTRRSSVARRSAEGFGTRRRKARARPRHRGAAADGERGERVSSGEPFEQLVLEHLGAGIGLEPQVVLRGREERGLRNEAHDLRARRPRRRGARPRIFTVSKTRWSGVFSKFVMLIETCTWPRASSFTPIAFTKR